MKDRKNGAIKTLKPAVALFALLWVITAIIYPLTVFAVGRILFPAQSQGSLIYDKNGDVIGSTLIGQSFTGEKYFWSRPSATSGFPYNSLSSSGSNLGPTSRILVEGVYNRTRLFMLANGVSYVPSDAVMSSASGLDPHISLMSAQMQAQRVAKARGMEIDTVNRIVQKHTEYPLFGVLGEERVNVLLLNQALDDSEHT
ncbi:Potassium-transporting ATPase KdpC subunit [uncultured archaeon]|nr:Potassium-transporting ATPase KdpC subunit [uncultured archaeon]